MSAAVEDNIRVAPPRTFAGGLVATIVVTGVMYFGASMNVAGEFGAMIAMSPMMGKAIFVGAMPPAVASLMGLVLGLIVTAPARR